MEAIAARAGVGRATLYRRWPNKSALLYFCADQLAEVIQPADTGDFRKDLLSCLRTPGRTLIRRRSAGAAGPDVHRRGRARRADANVRGGQCRESPVRCGRGSSPSAATGGAASGRQHQSHRRHDRRCALTGRTFSASRSPPPMSGASSTRPSPGSWSNAAHDAGLTPRWSPPCREPGGPGRRAGCSCRHRTTAPRRASDPLSSRGPGGSKASASSTSIQQTVHSACP